MTQTQDRHLHTGIAGSLAIHTVLLLLLTWGLNTQTARQLLANNAAQKAKEPEVTLVFPDQFILEPPPVAEEPPPETQQFIRTTAAMESETAPANAAFQSDRNTRAASILPPTTTSATPLPEQKGIRQGKTELVNADFQAGKKASSPRPAAPSQAAPAAAAKPSPAPVPSQAEMDKEATGNRLPLEVRKPEPVASEPPAAQPAPAAPQVRDPEDAPPPLMTLPSDDADFMAHSKATEQQGSASREGANAVDAEATPRGRYESTFKTAIQKRWQESVYNGDFPGLGRLHITFYLDKNGVPQELHVASDAGEADPRMRELTLRAILDAKIPPIPAELIPTLENGRMKIVYEVILY